MTVDAVRGDDPSFDAHMMALGRLCVSWAYVDRLLNDVMQAMLGINAAQAAIIGTEADTVSARAKMVQKLVYESAMSDEWRATFLSVVDGLLNDLAPKRNRYVHDYWTVTDGTLHQMDRRASVKRAQSRQPLQLVFNTWSSVATNDVNNLCGEVAYCGLCLHCALSDLSIAANEGQPAKHSLLLSLGLKPRHR